MKRFLLAALIAILPTAGKAQPPQLVLQQAQVFGSFYLGARAPDLALTTTSGGTGTALGTSGPVAYVCNTGANAAYVRTGASTITVTAANGIPVMPGSCANIYATAATHIVGITASSTTTLQVSVGWGSAFAGGGGGGSSGGSTAVTVADGADVAQGATTDAACAGDNTSGCTVEARLQRLAQRLTTLITATGSPFQAGGNIGNTAFIANAGTNLNTSSLALDATVATTNTDLGPPGATACATDTGSCSINALLQRLAQRLTTIIAGAPVSLNPTPSIANGNGVIIAPSALATSGITPVVCGSAVSSCVLKASAGNLYSVYAECSAACWLMVFNSTTAPSNGATTAGVASGNMVDCVPIAAGGVGSISSNGMPPSVYSVGATAVISSTTCATLTLATTGFVKGLVQ